EVSAYLSDMKVALATLSDADAKCTEIEGNKERANAFRDEVVPAMAALRDPADKLEMIVDKEFWPMPSYGDLIFEV
ncbi:MAG: glutamine synthetase type III, partial [Lacrimispora sphenoides]